MRIVLFLALLAATPGTTTMAGAQSSARSAAMDSIFLRAQRLVNEGQGAAGRQLVDSLLGALPQRSDEYAEALYWRAALAATAAEAERDYRRLTVEFPLSSRAEDALILLAQFEMTRRDYALALRHLDRLVRDYPESGSLPRAHYWIGRVHLDRGDLPRGCASLASASEAAPRTNVELHNQIEFHTQRCLGVDTAGTVPSDASATVQARPPSQPDAPPPPRERATPTVAVQYTVQIAALDSRATAEELREKLRARGLDARVVGAGQLFRVRIGRYDTRAEAASVAADLRRRGISRDAWVAEAEVR